MILNDRLDGAVAHENVILPAATVQVTITGNVFVYKSVATTAAFAVIQLLL